MLRITRPEAHSFIRIDFARCCHVRITNICPRFRTHCAALRTIRNFLRCCSVQSCHPQNTAAALLDVIFRINRSTNTCEFGRRKLKGMATGSVWHCMDVVYPRSTPCVFSLEVRKTGGHLRGSSTLKSYRIVTFLPKNGRGASRCNQYIFDTINLSFESNFDR